MGRVRDVQLALHEGQPAHGHGPHELAALAEQTSLSPNHVEKLCRSLRTKGYIGYPDHRGKRRALVEVVIDKFPLADGTYTALRPRGRGCAVEVLAEVPAEVPAKSRRNSGQKPPTNQALH